MGKETAGPKKQVVVIKESLFVNHKRLQLEVAKEWACAPFTLEDISESTYLTITIMRKEKNKTYMCHRFKCRGNTRVDIENYIIKKELIKMNEEAKEFYVKRKEIWVPIEQKTLVKSGDKVAIEVSNKVPIKKTIFKISKKTVQ